MLQQFKREINDVSGTKSMVAYLYLCSLNRNGYGDWARLSEDQSRAANQKSAHYRITYGTGIHSRTGTGTGHGIC